MAKKRANGEGNIRKRSNGTWEARITIGTDPETGKKISKSVYGRTQKEAREKMAALQAESQDAFSSLINHSGNITTGQLINMWLEDWVPDVRVSTVFRYRAICNARVKPEFGDIPVTELTSIVIQRGINRMIKNGLAPRYISMIHCCLKKALEVAVKAGYIQKNPAEDCTMPKLATKDIIPLDIPEQKKLIAALEGHPYEKFFLTALFTGMRVGEVMGLTWDCVNFENNTIRVEKQLVNGQTYGGYRFFATKTGKVRVITVAPYVMDILRLRKAEQEAHKAAAGDLWDESKDMPGLVFTLRNGHHLCYNGVQSVYKTLLRHAGLPHHRLHDLRHTYAVNCIMAGEDVKTIQENLGHHSAVFTLDLYTHVTNTMRINASSKMQAFIQGTIYE